MTFTFTYHALQTIEAKGFDRAAVMAAAASPTVTYDNGRFPGQRRHIRNGIVAVVDPTSERIITVYANVTETPLREDQKDADALAYAEARKARAERDRKRNERRDRDRALTLALKSGKIKK